jgi:serine/threonine-protein kinase RsbW
MLGFFFSGIIPEMFDGDVLRLQYLNNVEIDPKDISIASDFGKGLLDYVLKSKAGTLSPTTE